MSQISDRIARWTPPEGFEPIASDVEGIEVFGPGPEDAGAPTGPVAARCPRCGGSARYDVRLGTLGCPFCGWADAQPDPGTEAVRQRAFTRDALEQGSVGFGIERRELDCGSCGAVIALQEGALTASCPFCASEQVAVRADAAAPGLRPQAIVPLQVDQAGAQAAVKRWLGAGWMHPDDLAAVATVGRLTAVYLPCWVFSAQLGCDWEAEVGTERTQRSYDPATDTWEEETVIDWAWRQGRVELSIADQLVSGTTRVSARILERLLSFDLAALVPYTPTLLAGSSALTYDVGLPDAWEEGRHEMRESGRQAALRDTGSRHVRAMSVDVALSDESWRHVLLPVWISAYPYDGRTFVVMVNGQSGMVSGQKPVAWWKIKAAIAALLAPGLICGLIGIPLLVLGIGAFLLAFALFLLIFGGVGAVWLWNTALQHEAE